MMSRITELPRRSATYLMQRGITGFQTIIPVVQSTHTYRTNNPPRCTLTTGKSAESAGFTVERERVLWRRYATIYERSVRYPDGRLVSFDVSKSGSGDSVFIFPFNTRTNEVTLLREYAPGDHSFSAGFVAGMYEPDKHNTLEGAAWAELSEEAQLAGGQLIPLNRHAVQADKYSSNRFHYFLSLDANKDESPGIMDLEEYIEVQSVPLGQVRGMIVNGDFNTPSSLLGMLALEELRNRGFE